MLFISIILSIWFVLWLANAAFIRDTFKLIVSWLIDEDDDEDIDPLLEKSENGSVYHLNCDHCHRLWWSIEPFPKFCPFCGEKRNEQNNK